MLCEEYKCQKFINGSCNTYPTMGVALRNRLGYCPVLGDGPNKPKTRVRDDKKRVGQQKSRKVK